MWGCTVSRVLENSGFPVQNNNARNSQPSSRPDKPATESATGTSHEPGVGQGSAMIERWSSLHTPTTMWSQAGAHARSAATSYRTHSQQAPRIPWCMCLPTCECVCSRRRNRLCITCHHCQQAARAKPPHMVTAAAGVIHYTARCGACGCIGSWIHTHNVRHPTAHTHTHTTSATKPGRPAPVGKHLLVAS